MIYDRWEICHIHIATSNLEQAMEQYSMLLGIEWGPILDIGALPVALQSSSGVDVSEGMREVWSLKGATDGGPFLELGESAPGSASQAVWGVPEGAHQLHHVGFYVDDLQLESAHLTANGFPRELTAGPPDGPAEVLAYHSSPTGTRFELVRVEDKEMIASYASSGQFDSGLIE